MDPTGEHLFGLVLDHLFHDSNTHKMDGSEKMKTGLECFQNLKIEMQWQYSNFIQLKGPTALSCHVMLVSPTALLPFSDFLFFLFSFFLLHRA